MEAEQEQNLLKIFMFINVVVWFMRKAMKRKKGRGENGSEDVSEAKRFEVRINEYFSVLLKKKGDGAVLHLNSNQDDKPKKVSVNDVPTELGGKRGDAEIEVPGYILDMAMDEEGNPVDCHSIFIWIKETNDPQFGIEFKVGDSGDYFSGEVLSEERIRKIFDDGFKKKEISAEAERKKPEPEPISGAVPNLIGTLEKVAEIKGKEEEKADKKEEKKPATTVNQEAEILGYTFMLEHNVSLELKFRTPPEGGELKAKVEVFSRKGELLEERNEEGEYAEFLPDSIRYLCSMLRKEQFPLRIVVETPDGMKEGNVG